MKLFAVPIPPHFQYFCVACERTFSSAERAPHAEAKRDPFQPYYCDQCAVVENKRRAA